MFRRSFGARSFASFWQYWNPVFGYGLGRYVYTPLYRVVPSAIALIATFVFCGALHDLVTMAVRGSIAFLFTPWFFFLGVGVVAGRAVSMDLSRYPWALRAGVNFAYLATCLAAALAVKNIWEI
jgi:D-alanyl-lipoteichoic acid acyltransferase DltB (MBOAT superfamily)